MAIARVLQRAVLACGMISLGCVAAQAADPKGAPGTVMDWTSVYLGVHGGHSSADIDWRSNYPSGNPALRPTDFDAGANIWGAQLGYMVQRGSWVFGSELSLSSGFDRDLKQGVNLFGGSFAGTMSARVNYLLTSTARVGYSWGNVLGYVKAGTAAASVSLTTDDNVAPDWTSHKQRLYTGWVIGAGIDYEIMPNLLLGLEYNYVTMDGGATTQRSDGTFFRSNIDLDSHSVLARLNLKLDAPVLSTLFPF